MSGVGRFSDQILDEIRARITISQIVGRKVTWDRKKSSPRKGDHWACCPFHGEKTPSFHADDRRGRYHCFGCKESGDIFTFLTASQGLSFPEAVVQLAGEAGVQLPTPDERAQKRADRADRLRTLLDDACSFFQDQLKFSNQFNDGAAAYLKGRGITGETAREFRLGYAPADSKLLIDHLKGRGFGIGEMIKAGLLKDNEGGFPYVRFRDRIMFPIEDRRGRVIAFGGRSLRADVKAKYINTAETFLFSKGQELYNQSRARQHAWEQDALLVVEGYLDVIGLWQGGIKHVVAPMGTAVTEAQLFGLWRMASEPCFLFDGDEAGAKAAKITGELALPVLQPGRSLSIASLPIGQDPDSLTRRECRLPLHHADCGRWRLVEAIENATPLHRSIWAGLMEDKVASTPERLAALVRKIQLLLGLIQDPAIRRYYQGLYAGMLRREFGIKERLRPVLSRGASSYSGRDAQRAKPSQMGPSDFGDGSKDAGAHPPIGMFDEETTLQCAQFPNTDMGNRKRFEARFGHMFRFCPGLDWLRWDSRRWTRLEDDGEVMKAVQEMVDAIGHEAETLSMSLLDEVIEEKPKGNSVMKSDLLRKWGVTSQGSGHVRCVPSLAQAFLKISADELDQDDWKLNVLNGTLVIKKRDDGGDYVTLQRHDPADYITKLAPVVYDREATCPTYDAFLHRVQPSQKVRRHIHIIGGLCLTGDISEHAMWFFFGKGRNGKSTWMDTVAHVIGDYSKLVDIAAFLDGGRSRRGGDATPERIPMIGARFLRTAEPDKGAKLAEGFIKEATGGEPMTARDLMKPIIEFLPKFTLVMSGNYRPRIDGTDEGIWSRLKLMPWPVIIPKAERDLTLGLKLKAEGSGILNLLLDGLCDWMDNGLCEPEEVALATADYRADSDPLGMFLDANTEPDIGGKVQSQTLYEVFKAWAKWSGEVKEWTAAGFGRAMGERGYARKRSSVIFWLDIKLTKGVGDYYDNNGEIKAPGAVAGDEAEPPPPDPDDPGIGDGYG